MDGSLDVRDGPVGMVSVLNFLELEPYFSKSTKNFTEARIHGVVAGDIASPKEKH